MPIYLTHFPSTYVVLLVDVIEIFFFFFVSEQNCVLDIHQTLNNFVNLFTFFISVLALRLLVFKFTVAFTTLPAAWGWPVSSPYSSHQL